MSLNNSYATKIDKLRAQIAATRAEIEQADTAPVPIETALARADEMIDHLRAGYSAPVTPFAESDYRTPSLIHPESHDMAQAIVQFIAWTAPDTLRERLHAEIRSHYADCPEGVTDAARAKRKAKLREDLLVMEIDEEKLIMSAAAEGQHFARRADADPAAIIAA